MLYDYLEAELHHAVLITFNPALVSVLRERLRIPVRALPPTFFVTLLFLVSLELFVSYSM